MTHHGAVEGLDITDKVAWAMLALAAGAGDEGVVGIRKRVGVGEIRGIVHGRRLP